MGARRRMWKVTYSRFLYFLNCFSKVVNQVGQAASSKRRCQTTRPSKIQDRIHYFGTLVLLHCRPALYPMIARILNQIPLGLDLLSLYPHTKASVDLEGWTYDHLIWYEYKKWSLTLLTYLNSWTGACRPWESVPLSEARIFFTYRIGQINIII